MTRTVIVAAAVLAALGAAGSAQAQPGPDELKPAFGGSIRVSNDTGEAVRVTSRNLGCMYEGGDHGSRLPEFRVEAHTSTPKQYIERRIAGDCLTRKASFEVYVVGVGVVEFSITRTGNFVISNNGSPGFLTATLQGHTCAVSVHPVRR